MNNEELREKVAIVTGAGQGIGAAVARALGAAGVKVAVNDLNPDHAEAVAAAIRAAGGQAIGVTADVANKFQCVNLVETTRREWERLDILVNGTAVKPAATILKMDEWAWQRCIDVNLKGTFLMSQLVGRVMADENRERGGLIVNIGVIPGPVEAMAGQAAFLAAKVGVLGFARECAREFTAYGIRVNTILADDMGGEETAAAVAHQVLALCSPGGLTVTGQEIQVQL